MMPCWTVQSNSVSLQNPDPELFTAALKAAGFNVNSLAYSQRFNSKLTADRFADSVSVKVLNDGSVQVTAAGAGTDLGKLANEVKRSYSAQVVQAAARKFGWNLKQETANKYAVQRRF